MRTLKQQAAKARRDANRTHDAAKARQNQSADYTCECGAKRSGTQSFGPSFQVYCLDCGGFVRPRATARVREEM